MSCPLEKVLSTPSQVEYLMLPYFDVSERNCTAYLLKMVRKTFFKTIKIGERHWTQLH